MQDKSELWNYVKNFHIVLVIGEIINIVMKNTLFSVLSYVLKIR